MLLPNETIVLRKELVDGIIERYKKTPSDIGSDSIYTDIRHYVETHPIGKKLLFRFPGKKLPSSKTVDRALNLDKVIDKNGATPDMRDLLCNYGFEMSWEEKMEDWLKKEYSYQNEKAESDRKRGKVKGRSKRNTSQPTSADEQGGTEEKPQSQTGWFTRSKFAIFISLATLIIVVVMLDKEEPRQETPNHVQEDFEQKQVDAVLALYNKLRSSSVEIKTVFMERYEYTSWWRKDSSDSFYESQIMPVPLLKIPTELLSADIKDGDAFLNGRNVEGVVTKIIDTIAPHKYLVETRGAVDTSLPTYTVFHDVVFSSNQIVEKEIVEYAFSPVLPDTVKFWLNRLVAHEPQYQSLNRLIAERSSEIIVMGCTRTIEDDFTGFTTFSVWYSPSTSKRITLVGILRAIYGLENSIKHFLSTKGIEVD